MSNKKLSQLPEQTTLIPTDLMYVASGGVSKKLQASVLKTWVNQGTATADLTALTSAVDLLQTNLTALSTTVAGKQDTMSAGSGVVISSTHEIIATVDLNPLTNRVTVAETTLAGKQDTLIAGTNISIVGNTISATGGSVDLAPLESRVSAVETGKQNTLVAGSNITIVGNTISAASSGGSSLPEPIIIPCGYFDQAIPATPTLVGHQMYIGNISFNRANMRVTLAEPLDISSTDIIYVNVEVINTLTGATVDTLPGAELPGFFRYTEFQNVAFAVPIFPGMHSFKVEAYASSPGTIARGITVYFDGMTTI